MRSGPSHILFAATAMVICCAVRAGAQTPALAAGSFVADRIDSSQLPVTDNVTDDEGSTYVVEFERLVLSLRPNQRFRAAVWFRRTLYSSDPRSRGRAPSLQTLSVNGTYRIVDGEIHFTPDSTAETRGLRMLTGQVESAERISVPFFYRNGAVERERTLHLARQANVL